MLHSVRGIISEKDHTHVIIEVGGFGLRVSVNETTFRKLPQLGSEAKLFCAMRIRDELVELYGFPDEPSLTLFELLNTVPGVGPRSALSVLDIDSPENVTAGILERRADILTRASGIGKKTAERIVLELHTKIKMEGAHALIDAIDADTEIEEVLLGLGYEKKDARAAAHGVPREHHSFEDRLKAALRILGRGK